jgi:hypothetical protein
MVRTAQPSALNAARGTAGTTILPKTTSWN